MFLVIRTQTGPAWDRSKPMEAQSEWDAHAGYMDRLVAEGVIVLGGPLEWPRVGLVFDTDSEADIAEISARDPWDGSHLETASVERWTIRLDGRSLSRS